MKYVIQFLIIAAFAFIGELLHWFIPLPIPASIYGIVLLFIALELKWVKVSDIREVSSFLIAVMGVSGAVTQFVIWRGKKNEQVKKRSETETK